MSVAVTAAARVRLTVAPLIAGVPLKETVCSLPPAGVFFTVNAVLAKLAAAPSASSKVSVRVVPSTAALLSVGRSPSTLCADCAASAVWVSVASFEDPSAMAPPLSASAFAATAIPSLSASPSATV